MNAIAYMENKGGLIEHRVQNVTPPPDAFKEVKPCPWRAAETCRVCQRDYPGIKCQEKEKQG